jgi:hypothetical protein
MLLTRDNQVLLVLYSVQQYWDETTENPLALHFLKHKIISTTCATVVYCGSFLFPTRMFGVRPYGVVLE